ncbi:fe86fa6d-d28e-4bc4-b0e2-1abc7e73b9ef [Thermothielavioides terrestris]|uniref:Fe86fa6d-d28e-4bc4-b0e2-1abc7e73b9ef n=1 Tax=Thermothielavioides terrestris TaxID=2587410 RepID=A0A3S4AUZ2_9PEZI|nr:fe86fa6d-d28e-4bc4-b0e2-1abc7e73b9ef [Thermothielavioides terrestris]
MVTDACPCWPEAPELTEPVPTAHCRLTFCSRRSLVRFMVFLASETSRLKTPVGKGTSVIRAGTWREQTNKQQPTQIEASEDQARVEQRLDASQIQKSKLLQLHQLRELEEHLHIVVEAEAEDAVQTKGIGQAQALEHCQDGLSDGILVSEVDAAEIETADNQAVQVQVAEAYPVESLRTERYYAAFEWLMRDLGGRPHWAKTFTVSPDEFASWYGDDWRAFRQVRDAVDPEGMFVGPWHRRYLLGECSSAGGEGEEIERLPLEEVGFFAREPAKGG